MHSAFAKTLLEEKAANILRECSDPVKPSFGDAQAVCADLIDHFKDGANAHMSAHDIEKKLLTMCPNRECTKKVTAFVNHVAMLVCDSHCDACSRPQGCCTQHPQ